MDCRNKCGNDGFIKSEPIVIRGLVPRIHAHGSSQHRNSEGEGHGTLVPDAHGWHFPRMAGGWVYIVSNKPNGTLYVGVTSDIARRAWEHREGVIEGFSNRYQLKRLVYVEAHPEIVLAIQREKTIKHWPRQWKINLIRQMNPAWRDLYDTLL